MGSLHVYSVNARLFYMITTEFLKNQFHVYAADEFDERNNLTTSNPRVYFEVYKRLATGKNFRNNDFRTLTQKVQTLVDYLLDAKLIDQGEHDYIEQIIALLPNNMHLISPLIYIISREKVSQKLQLQPYVGGGNLKFGKEYVIEQLQRSEFEVISMDDPPLTPFPNP